MIPVILRGDTARGITLSPAPGYDYGGCTLEVEFNGARRTFDGLAAGEGFTLALTADETARMQLGTGRVYMRLRNAAGEVLSLPWAKVKVTDAPGEVRAAQITIDPATLNVDDLTRSDPPDVVKSRINAILAFLRGLRVVALALIPLGTLADVTPKYAISDYIPGDMPIMTNVEEFVDAKVAAVGSKADAAYSAAESLADGVNSLEGTVGTHIRDTKNPHKVTAAQVGALPISGGTLTGDLAIGTEAKIELNAPSDDNGAGVNIGAGSSGGGWLSVAGGPYSGGYVNIGGSTMNGLGGTLTVKGGVDGGGVIEANGEGASIKKDGKEVATESYVDAKVENAVLPTNPTFSKAVLAVGLNIDTNSVAVLNEIASTFGGFPIEGTATTVGGLLAALAAAVAWLRKNKADKATTLAGYGITDAATKTELNAKADKSALAAKADKATTLAGYGITDGATKTELAELSAKVEYPLYAVPSTGVLKDRAINTTSLATVTVPDNFTDLLIRASVTSSLSVTMPEAITTKYGDTFPGEAGEYLITITKTGAAEAYVRTIKLEEVANA